ncbi:MAG: PKD domain-containing protein [Cyclobacteriaceae bacterium]
MWYTVLGSPATVELEYVWDDATPNTIVPAVDVGSGKYEATATHLYPKGGDQCNYQPSVQLRVNGVPCGSSLQTQNVTVWDTDSENGGVPRIDPILYRVCLGETAIVNFDDNSIWNCVPNSGESDRKNNAVRWVQWIYGTGSAANRIPGVQVNGIVESYDFAAPVEVLQGPIETSTSQSEFVTVSVPNNATYLGKEFEVTLRNWNICNPYDTDTTDGNFLNPTTGNPLGDSAFIETQARIVVVEKSDPAFITRLIDDSGAIQTEFCVGDRIYFEDQTPGITDADFIYKWEFYDDATGTTLLTISSSQFPKYEFMNPGTKMIRLTVTDNNSVGGCGGSIEKLVTIVETANAAIQTSAINGDPLSLVCYDPVSPQPQEVVFSDISTNFNPATSTWTWKFYDETGSEVLAEQKSGAVTQDSIKVSITNPGTYMAELIASASGVDCETRDTAYVHIYHPPAADFTFIAGCQSDSVTFESSATMPVVVNGDDIIIYEWDLDDDGTFETIGEGPFKHKFPAVGVYQVHHRVITNKGTCSHVITKPVTVEASPYVSFTPDITEGCGPLQVIFAVDTLIADQPVGVSDYIWHVKDLMDNTVQQYSIAPANTFDLLTFENNLASYANQEYEVWLEIKAANGCDAISEPDTITVFAGPPAEYVITNLSGGDTNCSPRTFNFEATAATQSLSPEQYVWTVFDEADSTVIHTQTILAPNANFSHTLTNDGPLVKQYRIRLQPEKTSACFGSYEELVIVNPAPSSAFDTVMVEADCQLVTYKVEAQQKGLFYDWHVSPLPINNPDYTKDTVSLVYVKDVSGTYPVNVQLTTFNFASCSSPTTTQTITIDPQEQINTSFLVTPSILELPNTTVSITNETNPGDWSYEWDFGDGTVSSEKDPAEHTYATKGEYTIKLKATGKYCFEEDSAKVIIQQTLPIVGFDYSTIEGCLPLEVTFTNHTVYADSSTILWNFGDGTISTEWNPVHTYYESGIYTISLQASNELGVVVTEEQEIIVDLTQGPKADFRPRLAQRYLRNEDVFFTNQSQRSEFYFWDFGDGTTSAEEEPVHQYSEVGYYDITLVASNSLGCSDTLVKQIFIEPLLPEVDFTYEPPKGCRPLTVQFRNLSRYAEADSYRWSFGEGEGVSTEENPVYTYYEPGFYTITLEASNSVGVTIVEKKEFSVEVYETPRAYFNLRPEKAFLGEPIYFVNLSYGAENYYWDFGDGTTSTDSNPEHTYETTGSFDIQLIAESNKGCMDTILVESAVIIEDGGTVQVPNAFTPNQFGPGGSEVIGADGKNDIFLPVFEGLTKFHMMVYNRWGEMMFESFDKNQGWNGYYKGKLCPKDAYVYKLELQFSDGNYKTIVGDVTLVR